MKKIIYILLLAASLQIAASNTSQASTPQPSTTIATSLTQSQVNTVFNNLLALEGTSDLTSLVAVNYYLLFISTDQNVNSRAQYLSDTFGSDFNDLLTTWSAYQQFSSSQKQQIQSLIKTASTVNSFGSSISNSDYQATFNEDFWNQVAMESKLLILVIIGANSAIQATSNANNLYNSLTSSAKQALDLDNHMDLMITAIEMYDYWNAFNSQQQQTFINTLYSTNSQS